MPQQESCTNQSLPRHPQIELLCECFESCSISTPLYFHVCSIFANLITPCARFPTGQSLWAAARGLVGCRAWYTANGLSSFYFHVEPPNIKRHQQSKEDGHGFSDTSDPPSQDAKTPQGMTWTWPKVEVSIPKASPPRRCLAMLRAKARRIPRGGISTSADPIPGHPRNARCIGWGSELHGSVAQGIWRKRRG